MRWKGDLLRWKRIRRGAFLAILLSGLVLFAWQTWFAPQLPFCRRRAAPPSVSESSPPRGERVEKRAREASSSWKRFPSKKSIESINPVVILRGEGHLFEVSNVLSIEDIVSKNAVTPFEKIVGLKQPFSVELLTREGRGAPVVRFFPFQRGEQFVGDKLPIWHRFERLCR